MSRVAIIAALPGELRPLARGWHHERRAAVDIWRWKFDGGEWVAACAGAGVEAATRAFAEVEKDGHVDVAISTGWAGALREELLPGQAHDVSTVIDARTGERFAVTGPPNDCCLVTNSRVADRQEKQRLASTYSAGLVDMEASGIARLAAMRRIPFYCVKGVSDGFSDQLPDFNRFISAKGRFQLLGFILYALIRPWHWPALIRMGENSKQAAQAIRESVLDILNERGSIRQRNGYPNRKH